MKPTSPHFTNSGQKNLLTTDVTKSIHVPQQLKNSKTRAGLRNYAF